MPILSRSNATLFSFVLIAGCNSTPAPELNASNYLSSAEIREQILNHTVTLSFNIKGAGLSNIQHFYDGQSLTYQHKVKSPYKTEIVSGSIRLVEGKGLCKIEKYGKRRGKEICWNFEFSDGKYFVIPSKKIRTPATVTKYKTF